VPDKKLSVYGLADFYEPRATLYYRVVTPLKGLHKLGLMDVIPRDKDRSEEERMRAMINSNIVLAWSVTRGAGRNLVDTFNQMEPIPTDHGMEFPPIIIADLDDAVEYCHPFNALGFVGYGVRNFNGQLLNPGDKLVVPAPNGKDRVLWEDGVTKIFNGLTFDIERNKKTVAEHYQTYSKCAGVTVTCEYLANLYKENGCENVYVFPNSVIEEDYFFADLAPHEGIRMIWEGGSSHMDSWFTIKDAVIEVLKEHPEVTFVMFGQQFEWFEKNVPPGQLEMHPWIDNLAYRQKRGNMGCDINICPLDDNPFTRSKSAIRFYEASLGPNPEVTIAANVGPYQEIEDGRTGMVYNSPKEFKMKLKGLIKNAELRKTLADNARNWVLDHRSVEQTVPGLFEFYKDTVARKRREYLVT
jgi:hypothetical protein